MKKFVSIMLAGLMMFSLTGCGSRTAIDSKDPADKIVAQAMEETKGAESYNADATAALSMGMMGMSYDMDLNIDMAYFSDPEKMKMKMDTEVLGQKVDVEMYMEKDGDDYIIYSSENGAEFEKQTLDVAEYEEYLTSMNADSLSYARDMTDLEKDGEEEVNGIKALKLTGKVNGDIITDIIKSNEMMKEYEQYFSLENLSDLGDIPMTIWIDPETGYFVKQDMDMTEFMQSYMAAVMESLGESMGESTEDLGVDISKYTMTMNYKDYNKAEDFEIPEVK